MLFLFNWTQNKNNTLKMQPTRRSARLAAKLEQPVTFKPEPEPVTQVNILQPFSDTCKMEITINYNTGPKTEIFDAAMLSKNMYRIILKNGTIYEGEILDTRFHGQGKFIYPITSIYEVRHPTYVGEFKNGMENGKGKYDFGGMHENYYEGDFVDGKWHGEGIRIINGKLYHKGQFVNDEPL